MAMFQNDFITDPSDGETITIGSGTMLSTKRENALVTQFLAGMASSQLMAFKSLFHSESDPDEKHWNDQLQFMDAEQTSQPLWVSILNSE